MISTSDTSPNFPNLSLRSFSDTVWLRPPMYNRFMAIFHATVYHQNTHNEPHRSPHIGRHRKSGLYSFAKLTFDSYKDELNIIQILWGKNSIIVARGAPHDVMILITFIFFTIIIIFKYENV